MNVLDIDKMNFDGNIVLVSHSQSRSDAIP